MTYSQREIVLALEQWGIGALALTPEQRQAVTDTLAEVVRVLDGAPRGTDPIAFGIWFNHERAPALARLSDALHPHQRGAALQQHDAELQRDQEIARALQQALGHDR